MKPPKLLDDLFLDLRDRRLLPVALVFVAALVAVPILLVDSAEAPLPAVVAEDAAVEAPEAEVSVLAEARRLRDYRTRLDASQETNPFEQQFLSSGSSASLEDSSAALASGEEGDDSSSTSDTTASASTTTTETEVEVEVKVETELISFRIDVLAGPVGDTREIKKVEPLDFLPTKRKPIAGFIAASANGNKAVFAVSSSVSRAKGDGRCRPSPSECDFLTLRVGEAQRLDYEVDGRTYRIKLLEITRVVTDED